MTFLLALSRRIDALTVAIGRWSSWLILAAVLVSAGNAVIRKAFNISSNAWLELQWYLFGTVFMLAAAYTLQRNEHIRIDIVSSMLPARLRSWIDMVGHVLFLLPLTVLMTWLTSIFFWKSFASGEISGSEGGLILWPARLAIFAGFVLLLMQAVSEIVKRAAIIMGLLPEPRSGGGHGAGHGPGESGAGEGAR